MGAYLLYIIILAALGLANSYFLYKTRRRNHGNHQSCRTFFDCHLVDQKRFSSHFGVPLEFLGLGFYGLLALFALVSWAFPALMHPLILLLLSGLACASLFFSLYFTLAQLLALKKLCTWCLINIPLILGLVYLLVQLFNGGLISAIVEYKTLVVLAHVFGAVIGVGGATYSDIFFFKFLKDYKISATEARVLGSMAEVIWFGVAVILVSGLAVWLPKMEILNESPKFLVKVIAVAVVIINGMFLNLFVTPRVAKIGFGEKHDHMPGELHRYRNLSFASGAISITSWYTAFILGVLPVADFPLNFRQTLLIYLGVVLCGIIGSQLLERYYDFKSHRK